MSLVIASGLTWSTLAGAALSARAQVSAAVAAGDAQHYVKIVVLLTAPGLSQTIVSQAGPGMGIQVLTAKGPHSTNYMTVEYVGHALYVKADRGFLIGSFGLSSTAVAPLVNKWAVVSKSSPAYANVLAAVTITSAMSSLTQLGPVTTEPSTVVAGVKVKVLRDAIPKTSSTQAGTETLYIANSAPALPVQARFVATGYSSLDTFSHWGKHFTVHAPITSLRIPPAPAG